MGMGSVCALEPSADEAGEANGDACTVLEEMPNIPIPPTVITFTNPPKKDIENTRSLDLATCPVEQESMVAETENSFWERDEKRKAEEEQEMAIQAAAADEEAARQAARKKLEQEAAQEMAIQAAAADEEAARQA